MKLYRSDKGFALPLVMTLIVVILISSSALLSFLSTRTLALKQHQNDLKSYNLAVSGMESFIKYLNQITTQNKEDYFLAYTGWQGPYSLATPENDAITYSFTYSTGDNAIYYVTSKAIVGTGAFQKTNSVTYSVNLATPNYRVSGTQKAIYVQTGGSAKGVPSSISVNYNANVKSSIDTQMGNMSSSLINQITTYQQKAVQFTNNGTATSIANEIASSSGDPIIIETSGITSSDANIQFGDASHPVVLILDSDLTLNSAQTLDVYGSLIVLGSFTANNAITVNMHRVNNSLGDLIVKDGSLTFNNTATLNIDNSLATINTLAATSNGSMNFNNGATVSAQSILVGNTLNVQNNLSLTANLDVYTGNVSAMNNAQITATKGDLFVDNSFTANNGTSITAGGNIAIGSSISLDSNTTINTGNGGTSSLNLGNTMILGPQWDITKQ
ncbi:MAG TPA: hypothetical protein VHQ46_02795 [Desulfobacteria bacterium]|nr:hypothetical protein [Desulfobacteria bacterium]